MLDQGELYDGLSTSSGTRIKADQTIEEDAPKAIPVSIVIAA